MKRLALSILFGFLTIGIMFIWSRPASAQSPVYYVIPIIDGTMGDNDWYVSDVSITWVIPPDTTVYNGCDTLLIDQDTPPDGIQLYCIVVDAFDEYYGGFIVIKRDATPPIVATNLPTDPPLSLSEGDSYQVDASASTDNASGVASIQWSLDGDGLFDDGNPAVYQTIDGLANAQANPEILIAQAIDQAGNVSEAAFPVVVYNLPPALDPLQDIGPLYGRYNLTAPFSDPGILDTHTGSIDWGDDILEAGVILESNGLGSLRGIHTYKRRGTYTLTLTLQDKDGAAISTTQRVNVVSTGGVSFPIAASFTHFSGSTVYNTESNYIIPLLLNADDTMAEAILGLDPGGCIGMLWFETGGADPQSLAPLGMCLTDPSVIAAEFNAWLADDQGLPGPELHIPLELSGIGPGMAQIWTNPDPLTAGVFVQGADDLTYRRYADLLFPPGGFALTTGIDTTYRPYVSLFATPSLTNIDPITWGWIQTIYDPDDLLPAVSAPGTLVEFSGNPLPVIHDPDTLSGRMALLQDSIGAYTYDGIITLQNNLKLNQVLDKVIRAWRELRDDKALLELNKFIDDVIYLVDQGQLLSDDGDWIIGEARHMINSRLDWQNPSGLDPIPTDACDGSVGSCPDTITPCIVSGHYITLAVDDNSTASNPDGSAGAPFATLVDALAYAQEMGACGVRLSIEPGTYSGDLNITRHTQISGQGNRNQIQIQGLITNEGANVLEIDHVKIIGNPLALPGGIYNNHPCAVVILNEVIIYGVYGFGIRQHGGSLRVSNVTIQETKALPEYISQGTGIYLSCGTQARLFRVELFGNMSSGLQVVGQETYVRATLLEVKDTTLHPYWVTVAEHFGDEIHYVALWLGSGGVQVRDGATLVASAIYIHDNRGLGINVTGNGNARLTFADLLRSKYYCCTGENNDKLAGPAANAIVSAGGQLEIQYFHIEESEECGVSIRFGGEVDLSYGKVRWNATGICNSTDVEYDLTRLNHEVIYWGNGANFASYKNALDPGDTFPDEDMEDIIDP